jgi:hypothetical protein
MAEEAKKSDSLSKQSADASTTSSDSDVQRPNVCRHVSDDATAISTDNLFVAVSILAPLLAKQPKKKLVDDVESLLWLIDRHGGSANWLLVVPGHGVCRVSLAGRGLARKLRVVMCQGECGDVLRAHIRAHFKK